MDLDQTSSEGQSPYLRPLWLLVVTLKAIRPQLASRWAYHSLSYVDVSAYIFDILYLLPCIDFMTSPHSVAGGLLPI